MRPVTRFQSTRSRPRGATDQARPADPIRSVGNRDSLGVDQIVVHPLKEGLEDFRAPNGFAGQRDGPLVFGTELAHISAGNAFRDCVKGLKKIPLRVLPSDYDVDLVGDEFGRQDLADPAETHMEPGVSALEKLKLDREPLFVLGVPMEEGFVHPASAVQLARPWLAACFGLVDCEVVV
jgi:hypothetical protein